MDAREPMLLTAEALAHPLELGQRRTSPHYPVGPLLLRCGLCQQVLVEQPGHLEDIVQAVISHRDAGCRGDGEP